MATFRLKESRLDPGRGPRVDVVVPAGEPWLGRSRAQGQMLRIVDLEGNQAVDTLFYNADDPSERYSAADTIRGSRATSTSPPAPCCARPSNRTLLTIVADTCGRHDTLGGACSAESNTVRYGQHTQAHAQLPRQLPAGGGPRGHPAVASAT